MTQTHTLTLTQGIGYRGKMSERPYVAEITGTDRALHFARRFLDADSVERDHFGRPRYTRTYGYDLVPGLYEIDECGTRRYLIVWVKISGRIGVTNPPVERVDMMARLMTDGQPFEAARLSTRPAQVV